MKVPYLVICSSLKDVMAFRKMGFKNAEAIAPDSENSMIPEHVMNAYKFKYQSIVTLFDNDQAGIESMKKYELKYNIPYVLLELSKDLSDSLRDHGVNKTRDTLTPLLKEKLNKPVITQ
jgi:DNA primase